MDVLTLTIVNVFIAGGAGTLLWLLYLADKHQHYLLYWAIAASCMFASSSLSTLYHLGLPLPYWSTPALSNTLIISLHLALLAGLYQYFRLPLKRRWFVIVQEPSTLAGAHLLSPMPAMWLTTRKAAFQ